MRGPTLSSTDPPSDDAERIRAAYARRSGSVEPNRYSLARPGNALALAQRMRVLRDALARRGVASLGDLEILEVGCGVGGELAALIAAGADPTHLSGIDLLEGAIAAARKRVPEAHLIAGDASRLPYRDGSFDIVYQATALSSMPSAAMRVVVATEMWRVARPGGLIVSYDFAWNPRNRDTIGIGTKELHRLFPGMPLEVHRATLVPPLARWIGDHSERALRIVARIPLLQTHRLAIVTVPR